MINIGEAATRKLGPLPTWAWAGVVGVGVLAYRSLGGGGGSGRSSGSQATIGGDGAGFSPPSMPDAAPYPYEGGTPTQPPIGGGALPGVIDGDALTGVIGQVSSAFTLQRQLNDALSRLSVLLGSRSTLQTKINANLDAYRAGKISKATYTNRKTQYEKELAEVKAKIDSQNSLIADLKARLAKLFAAPAAA